LFTDFVYLFNREGAREHKWGEQQREREKQVPLPAEQGAWCGPGMMT